MSHILYHNKYTGMRGPWGSDFFFGKAEGHSTLMRSIGDHSPGSLKGDVSKILGTSLKFPELCRKGFSQSSNHQVLHHFITNGKTTNLFVQHDAVLDFCLQRGVSQLFHTTPSLRKFCKMTHPWASSPEIQVPWAEVRNPIFYEASWKLWCGLSSDRSVGAVLWPTAVLKATRETLVDRDALADFRPAPALSLSLGQILPRGWPQGWYVPSRSPWTPHPALLLLWMSARQFSGSFGASLFPRSLARVLFNMVSLRPKSGNLSPWGWPGGYLTKPVHSGVDSLGWAWPNRIDSRFVQFGLEGTTKHPTLCLWLLPFKKIDSMNDT